MIFVTVVDGVIVGTSKPPKDVTISPERIAALEARGVYAVPDGVEVSTFRVFDRNAYPETSGIGPARPEVRRVISRGEFMDRWSLAAQMALEQIAEQPDASGRLVKVFTRRLEATPDVNLDSPRLTAPLEQIKAILMNAGVPGWATQQEADASVAAILA